MTAITRFATLRTATRIASDLQDLPMPPDAWSLSESLEQHKMGQRETALSVVTLHNPDASKSWWHRPHHALLHRAHMSARLFSERLSTPSIAVAGRAGGAALARSAASCVADWLGRGTTHAVAGRAACAALARGAALAVAQWLRRRRRRRRGGTTLAVARRAAGAALAGATASAVAEGLRWWRG